ncbi:MAG: gamma carbonic anhydrase family protein [Promethearchaeota archaeon]
MAIYQFRGKAPRLHPSAYVSRHAVLVGDVEVGPHCTIFPNVVVEGDIGPVRIGAYTNLQSGALVHTVMDHPVELGEYVTVGHGAIVHGATVGDLATIGIGAVVASKSQVGRGAIVGEGALVPQKKSIPPLTMAVGVPARVVKELGPGAEDDAREIALHYAEWGERRAGDLKRVGPP